MDAEPIAWTTYHGDVVKVFRASLAIVRDPDRRLVEDWRWHVQARNGRILEHGEGHPRRRNAVRAALRHHPRVEPE